MHFPAGCCKRQLNCAALSVVSLILVFFFIIFFIFSWDHFDYVPLVNDYFMFCLLGVLVLLSMPDQEIDWKD